MTDKVNDIWGAFVDANPEEYTIHNEIGNAYINFMNNEKSKAAIKAIEFTLKYLKEKKIES